MGNHHRLTLALRLGHNAFIADMYAFHLSPKNPCRLSASNQTQEFAHNSHFMIQSLKRMNAVSDYRFPTEDEETALIEEVSEMFAAMGMGSKPIPLIPDEFAKLLFAVNPDIFGGRLENAGRWLQERIETAEQERQEDEARQMRRFLVDFPTTTMH